MGTIVPHFVATLIYLSQNYSYYIRATGPLQDFSRLFSRKLFETSVKVA